jgi:hypothetical protein
LIFVVQASRPHRVDDSGIVQARRLHHNRITVVFVGQASRLPGGRLEIRNPKSPFGRSTGGSMCSADSCFSGLV